MIATSVIVTQEPEHITVRGTRWHDNEAEKQIIGGAHQAYNSPG